MRTQDRLDETQTYRAKGSEKTSVLMHIEIPKRHRESGKEKNSWTEKKVCKERERGRVGREKERKKKNLELGKKDRE